LILGSSDPYAILTVGATTYKTPTITNNCNPSWNRTYDFPIGMINLSKKIKFFSNMYI